MLDLPLALAVVSLASTVLLGGRVVFRNEAHVEELRRHCESHSGKIQALDAIANESKAAHLVVVERVSSLSNSVSEKASSESVIALRGELAAIRAEVSGGLGDLK